MFKKQRQLPDIETRQPPPAETSLFVSYGPGFCLKIHLRALSIKTQSFKAETSEGSRGAAEVMASVLRV